MEKRSHRERLIRCSGAAVIADETYKKLAGKFDPRSSEDMRNAKPILLNDI